MTAGLVLGGALAASAAGGSGQSGVDGARIEALQARESSPGFRRAVVVYQTLRESYENWYALPSCRPLKEVLGGYQELFQSGDPQVAAAALDGALQLTFDMLPQELALLKVRQLPLTDEVRARSATFGNPPAALTAGDELVEIRRVRLGQLADGDIVSLAFEARSRTGRPERVALDLRVMNDARNQQTSAFFDVPATGWRRIETTLGRMFEDQDVDASYRVLPSVSLVRATFGSVPAGFGGEAHSDVAFERRFQRTYWVREGAPE